MKLLKINKYKTHVILLYSNNVVVDFLYDTFYHYNLYQECISLDTFLKAKQYDKELRLYLKLLKLCAKTYVNNTKINSFLKDYDETTKNNLLDKLHKEGYLDDYKMIFDYYSHQYSKMGPLKLEQKLKNMGFDSNDIEMLLKNLDYDEWLFSFLEYNNISIKELSLDNIKLLVKIGFPEWLLSKYHSFD